MEPRRDHPQGLTGTLATLRAENGGRGNRKRISAWGCRVLEGPGENFEGSKTASAGTGGGYWREWMPVLTGNTRPVEKVDNLEQKKRCH